MLRLRTIVATLLAGVVATAVALPVDVPTAEAAGNTVGTRVGFSNGYETLWISDADLARDLDGMAAVGARWLRLDFDWPSVQAGGRNSWNWSHIDRVVREAKARGLRILAMPAYTPTWARPANTPDKHPPTNPDDFARFVRAAVERYAPQGVRHWEIWNEPNTSSFWWPSPNVTAYATLFKKASSAIRAVDPSATVITAGLAPAADVPGQQIAPNTFVSRLYQEGAGPYLDAVGMHPYTFPYAPMLAADWNPFYQLPSMHQIMASHGDGAKKIWATEVGWGTGTSGHAVSQETQARMIREMVDAWLAYPFAANIFYYSFRDHGTNAADIWANFGIVKRNWSSKAARDAMRSALTRSLPGAQPGTRSPGSGSSSPASKATQGLWVASTDARLFSTGGPRPPASSSLRLHRPIVGAASTPTGKGAWLVAGDGGIFSYGDARFYGSTGAMRLNQPIVGMAATPTGRGYWLVASDGGIFSFGDARFYGSTGAMRLNQPIVGMAATPTGRGYWLVASDGGIFSFGDARFYGSTGAIRLDQPIVGMASSPRGRGYWLVASDGGIFSFGDAKFHGSTGGRALAAPIVGIAPSASGKGYWLVGGNGSVFSFGDAPAGRSVSGATVADAVMVGK